MADLKNVFSWSKSRDEEFRECRRKYFYARYLSWGGWEARAARDVRLAYIYKNLKNRFAWKGEAVHHTIEHVLKAARSGAPLPLEHALSQLTDTMRRDFRASKAKKYLENPKNHLGLFEHEYEKPVSDEIWKKIHDEAAECLRHFYNSALYAELLKDDVKKWLVVEDLEAFDFEGAKIFVKLDFAREKEDFTEIYDWKTGKDDPSADNSTQIGAYVLYAMQKWRLPVGKIRAYLLNLTSAKPVPRPQIVDETLLIKARNTVRSSVQTMHALLENVSENIPKSREEFSFTENTRLCGFCNFYKICEKYAHA